MKKMLYVSNVDWNWIKQRPHFIAEELSKYFDLEVIYRHRYNRNLLNQGNTHSKLKLSKYYLLPIIDRFSKFSIINNKLKELILTHEYHRGNGAVLFLTAPDQYVPYLEHYQGKIIYDCMDNHLEFTENLSKANYLRLLEQKLLTRANLVTVTSEYLARVLVNRYNFDAGKIRIERNAFSGSNQPSHIEKKVDKDGKVKVAYFGTISKWFNFDYIQQSLNDCPNLTYELIGPIDGVSLPQNERIKYLGIVDHDKLQETVEDADALIMPFTLNEITLAVDPVKLYEYLNLAKNIVTVKYPEVERFSKFVYFYENYPEFLSAVLSATREPLKYSDGDRLSFLHENSWEVRARNIYNEIIKL